jgi:hypothetical protein
MLDDPRAGALSGTLMILGWSRATELWQSGKIA